MLFYRILLKRGGKMLNGIAILKVCYYDNTKRDSIKCVKAARFTSSDGKNIETIGNIVSWSKGQIIQMVSGLPDKTKVYTAAVSENVYSLGLEVEAYPESEPKYLRVKGSGSERDDLDEIPTYEAHC